MLFTLPFFGEQFQITKQLVRTAAGLASFSALYYAVASAVDSTNRDEFIASRSRLQETFRERGEYLELLAERDLAVLVGWDRRPICGAPPSAYPRADAG